MYLPSQHVKMKIVIDNISDGEIVSYPILLIRGKIDNVDRLSLDEESNGSINSKHQIFLTHTSDHHGRNKEYLHSIPVCYVSETSAKFKLLLQLKTGINHISLEYFRVRRNLAIKYDPFSYDLQRHRIKLLYIVCSDSDGNFQSPGESGSDLKTQKQIENEQEKKTNDIASAKKRISLAGSVIQSIIAESLEVHGFGRKTIHFFNEERNNVRTKIDEDEAHPVTYIFKSKLSTQEVFAMNQRQLWEYHAKEIVSSESNTSSAENQKLKYLAIHSATRFFNPSGTIPKDHAEVLSLTKGHVSIGGGGLALLGSGCLYTWPENLSEVLPRFSDVTEIDSIGYMDDSAYRKTIGGCYATTLGSLIHELGHTFDLGHSANGFMARGFDDIDRFFTLSNKVSKSENPSKSTASLMCCISSCINKIGSSPFHYPALPSHVKIKGTNYLEEYQQKQYYRKMMIEFGNAFWDKSSAIILSAHPWLNASAAASGNQISYLSDLRHVQSTNTDFLLLEMRDKSGNILDFVDLSGQGSQFIDLNPYIDQLGDKFHTFLCICCDGELLKSKI